MGGEEGARTIEPRDPTVRTTCRASPIAWCSCSRIIVLFSALLEVVTFPQVAGTNRGGEAADGDPEERFDRTRCGKHRCGANFFVLTSLSQGLVLESGIDWSQDERLQSLIVDPSSLDPDS
jgi:hypothetical protein